MCRGLNHTITLKNYFKKPRKYLVPLLFLLISLIHQMSPLLIVFIPTYTYIYKCTHHFFIKIEKGKLGVFLSFCYCFPHISVIAAIH